MEATVLAVANWLYLVIVLGVIVSAGEFFSYLDLCKPIRWKPTTLRGATSRTSCGR